MELIPVRGRWTFNQFPELRTYDVVPDSFLSRVRTVLRAGSGQRDQLLGLPILPTSSPHTETSKESHRCFPFLGRLAREYEESCDLFQGRAG